LGRQLVGWIAAYAFVLHAVFAGMVATHVRIASKLAQNVKHVGYPAADEFRPTFSDAALPVYGGRVKITIELARADNARGQRLIVEYQPCDDRACLAVVSRRVVVD